MIIACLVQCRRLHHDPTRLIWYTEVLFHGRRVGEAYGEMQELSLRTGGHWRVKLLCR